MSQFNPFIELHKLKAGSEDDPLGSGWENLATEVLAFFLRCDPLTLEHLCRSILGTDYEQPLGVETQLGTEYGTPDICIPLRSGREFIIENKIDSPLGDRQLERYLTTRSRGSGHPNLVALSFGRHQRVAPEVLENERYKHPDGRDHFIWEDLCKVVRERAPKDGSPEDFLRVAFHEYLIFLGFVSNLQGEWTKLFKDRTIAENQLVQKSFGRQLGRVRKFLEGRGFRVTNVSHFGLDARPPSPRPYLKIGVMPFVVPTGRIDVGPEVLLVEVIYDTPSPPPHALKMFEAFPRPHVDPSGMKWYPMRPRKMTNPRVRLAFVSDLRAFVGRDDIEPTLYASCSSVFERVLSQADEIPQG